MARILIGNESIYYTRTNAQATTTAIFIHGSGGNHKTWPHDLRSIGNTGVVLLDLPGHGLSTGSGRSSVDDYAAFIKDFTNALGLTQVVLAGHSLGGAIALTLGLARPSWLTALVLVGTGVRLRVHSDILAGIRQDYAQTIDLICRWAFSPDAAPDLVDGSRKAMLDTHPEVTRDDFMACNAFDMGVRVTDIRYPTLVLAASDDRLTPPKYGRFLYRHIQGSRYRLIEGAGHMMAMEKPTLFLNELTLFLDALT